MALYVQFLRKTAATWTSDNTVLKAGQVGIETDTRLGKFGDGTTAWNSLLYMWGAPGGYTPGGTDVAVADGGTGASTASGARTNLGLVIGTDVEAHDADLTTIAGLAPSNDDVLQRKAGAWTNRTPAQLKTDLALAEADITGLVSDLGTLTSGLAGKQPLDSDLTTIAGLTATTDNFLVAVASAWASRTPAQVKTTLAITEADVASLPADLAAKLAAANNLSDIADPTTARWNLKVPSQSRAVVVATTNQTLSGLPTVDGVTLTDSNRILNTANSSASENGLWQVHSGAWTRPADFPAAGVIQACTVLIAGGTSYASSVWAMTNTGSITIDSGSQTWVIINTTSPQTLTNKNLASGTNTFPTLNQNTSGTAANLSGTPALPNGTTATTQAAADNSTKLATTAYVDTGLALKAWLPQYVARTTDLARISTATPADDTQLTLTGLVTGAVYEVSAFLIVDGGITADFLIGWTLPTLSIFNWITDGPITSAGSGVFETAVGRQWNAAAGTCAFGTAGVGSKSVARPWGYLTAGSGGGSTITLKWSQNSSVATNTTLYTGSALRLLRVA